MGKNRSYRLVIMLAILLLASSFFYLPYYVSKPGMAKELAPIVEVEGGHEEAGSLMLTTIRMGRANIYAYIMAKFSDYQHIYSVDEIRGEHETDEEYTVRQLYMMDHSKTTAIEVAYKKAGLPIHYEYNGVYVLNVLPDMPAEGKIKSGDRITAIDGQLFESSSEFIEYVSAKKAGEKVSLTVEQDENSKDIALTLKQLGETGEKAGIGIMLVDDKEINVTPEVKVDSDEIGGPSAGLMFSLEIYNQLIEEDLTKGYDIAGTGTISPDGTVGPIGGIEQKVVAADKAGAEIFLAPSESGAKDSNYYDAVRAAEDINTDMKVIPVDSFNDAVNYLKELEQKTS